MQPKDETDGGYQRRKPEDTKDGASRHKTWSPESPAIKSSPGNTTRIDILNSTPLTPTYRAGTSQSRDKPSAPVTINRLSGLKAIALRPLM